MKWRPSCLKANSGSNELYNRNLVALPNRAWSMDLSHFNSKIETKYQTALKLFIVVDYSTREVLVASPPLGGGGLLNTLNGAL